VYQDLYARNQSDIQYNFIGEVLKNQMIYRKSGASDHVRTSENTLDHVGRTKEMHYTLKEGTVFKVPRFKMFSMGYDEIGRLATKAVQPTNAIGSKQTGLWTNVNTWLSGMLPTITDPVVINQGHIVTVPSGQTVTAGSLFDKGTLTFQNSSTLQMGILPANRQGAALQLINYKYNIRGNMIGVNLDAAGNPQTSEDKLFSYRLDYHEDLKYFDGSISKQSWKTHGTDPSIRTYQFSYDRANRLKNAIYSGGQTGENFSIPNVAYDENGNITFMSRMGKSGSATVRIDSLDYQYLNGGNKLKTVTDNASDAQADGFKNGTNSGDDYEYYADGKLKKDLNRSISLIEYNFLDLVSKVTRINGDYVEYVYTSTGEKRRTKRVIGGAESYTFYDGEMIYTATGAITSLNDYKLSEIQNSEGRFVNGKFEYGYTDHLGNLRISYKDSLGTAFIVHNKAYDAWGMEIKPLRYSLSGALQDRYTWQGKEDLALDGLEDWSDFGWRIEDRALGRWFTPDPADQFQSISPFAYCANNPVSHIDPDGRALPALAVIGIAMAISGVTYTASVAFSRGGFDNWNWNEFGRNVIVGGASSIFTMGVGTAFGNIGTVGNEVARALTHGHVQGMLSSVQGGNYGTSFLSGAIGSGFSSGATALNLGDGGVILSGGLSGGVGSALSGGNFFEGFGQGSIIALANHTLHKGLDRPKPKKPINWAKVADGTITVIGGGAATVGGCLACLTGVGAPAGAVGITLGIPTVGFGTANIIDGFQGNSSDIPGGMFEALDKGFGGNGTVGQVGDAFSGGLPKSGFDKVMLVYDISQWNPTQSVLNTPSITPSGKLLGVTPADNTRVNNRYISPFKK
jgi:RHS repeat-associated protein